MDASTKPIRLAVYGTLRRGQRSGHRAAWLPTLRRLGPCTLPGTLYDLGPYPGLLPGAGTVIGELLEVPDPETLQAIDDYESFDPRCESRSEFVRRRVTVTTRGASVVAWVYYYNRPVGGCRLIRSGDWVHRQPGWRRT